MTSDRSFTCFHTELCSSNVCTWLTSAVCSRVWGDVLNGYGMDLIEITPRELAVADESEVAA